MTEYNIFCYSEIFKDKDSFQQKPYRAFNKEVGKVRYNEIKEKVKKILGCPNLNLKDFWEQVTNEQWEQLLSIPEAKDFKKGFEHISGIKIDIKTNDCNGKIVDIEGKKYKLNLITTK